MDSQGNNESKKKANRWIQRETTRVRKRQTDGFKGNQRESERVREKVDAVLNLS